VAELPPLVSAIAAGDAAAFGQWVAGGEPRIRRSLASFAATVDTEAVVQETLLRIWQVAPRFKADGRPDGLLRLAIRIARNLAISEVRRSRVQPMEIERLQREADRHAEAPVVSDPMLRELIRRCHELLPSNPAAALAQRIASRGGRHDADLAEEIGMKLNTFLQNIRRARIGLTKCLKGQGVALPEAVTR
jgi:DNA-directed RNA polymerase specialized sigma24 family protein